MKLKPEEISSVIKEQIEKNPLSSRDFTEEFTVCFEME